MQAGCEREPQLAEVQVGDRVVLAHVEGGVEGLGGAVPDRRHGIEHAAPARGQVQAGTRPAPPAAIPDRVVQRHQVKPMVGVKVSDDDCGQRPRVVQSQLRGDPRSAVQQDALGVALDQVPGGPLAGVRPRRAAAEHCQ